MGAPQAVLYSIQIRRSRDRLNQFRNCPIETHTWAGTLAFIPASARGDLGGNFGSHGSGIHPIPSNQKWKSAENPSRIV